MIIKIQEKSVYGGMLQANLKERIDSFFDSYANQTPCHL